MVKLAHNVWTKGKFRNHKDGDLTVRKYLTLLSSQYEKPSHDIKLEDKRYKDFFKYHKEGMNALDDLCIAQMPVFAIIQRQNREFLRLRDIGESFGLDKVHLRSGKSVPWDGRKLLDKLKFVSTDELFSVPDTADFADRHDYVDIGATGDV